jgi:hypothetical protein
VVENDGGSSEPAAAPRDGSCVWLEFVAGCCRRMGVVILGLGGGGGKGRDGASERFGGRIVVGVEEREDKWGRTGSTGEFGCGGEA